MRELPNPVGKLIADFVFSLEDLEVLQLCPAKGTTVGFEITGNATDGYKMTIVVMQPTENYHNYNDRN